MGRSWKESYDIVRKETILNMTVTENIGQRWITLNKTDYFESNESNQPI